MSAPRGAALALAFAACAPAPARSGEAPAAPAAALEGVELVAADGALRARAERAEAADGSVRAEAVEVRAAAADGRVLEVRAPRADWDLATRRAHFEGGVEARVGDVVLRAPTLDAWFDEDRRVRRARAEGGVEVEQGSRRASADAAEVDVPSGTVVLEGRAEVRDPAGALSGARIVLRVDEERVGCEDCRLVLPVPGDASR